MTAKTRPEFPAEIFVIKDAEGMLIADSDAIGFEHNERVATYKLVKVSKKRVTHTLEEV